MSPPWERGNLAGPANVEDLSLDARLGDLAAVIDVAGLERVALLGMSHGGPLAIAYAALHPERANIGAAAYESVLAGLTRRVLGGPRCASFDTEWVPREYLADYYRVVGPDERETIAFFADAMREAPAGEAVLVFGTGPTLHHVFLAAPKASEIHLADYLPANLEEIERWRAGDPDAHDWRAFVRFTLECEGLTAATDDRAAWEVLMANITGLVGPGGLFITAALRRCRSYLVADKRFPSANVDEHDMRRVLAPGFSPRVQVCDLQGHDAQGYSSVVLAHARRRARELRPVRGPRSGILLSGKSVSEIACSRQISATERSPRSDASTSSSFRDALNFRYFLALLIEVLLSIERPMLGGAPPTSTAAPHSECSTDDGAGARRE